MEFEIVNKITNEVLEFFLRHCGLTVTENKKEAKKFKKELVRDYGTKFYISEKIKPLPCRFTAVDG